MTENPDAPPPKNHDEGSDEDKGDESDMRQHEFKWYLKTDKFFKIVTTRWGIFTIISGVCYLYEIIWTIAGVNNYCDITRTFNSNKGGTATCLTTAAKIPITKNDIASVSAVYDFPILIVTIYHMIEWIRWTILATSALVDANLIPVFYLLHLNICFGFFAMLIAIIGGSTAASGCSEAQPERARFLQLQIICLVMWIPTSFLPYVYMKMKGDQWVHAQWIKDPEEDDEDENKEGKADD